MALNYSTDKDAGVIGITSTSNQSETQEKEAEVVETETESSQANTDVTKSQKSYFQKADEIVEKYDHWFIVASSASIIAVEGYWGIKKLS